MHSQGRNHQFAYHPPRIAANQPQHSQFQPHHHHHHHHAHPPAAAAAAAMDSSSRRYVSNNPMPSLPHPHASAPPQLHHHHHPRLHFEPPNHNRSHVEFNNVADKFVLRENHHHHHQIVNANQSMSSIFGSPSMAYTPSPGLDRQAIMAHRSRVVTGSGSSNNNNDNSNIGGIFDSQVPPDVPLSWPRPGRPNPNPNPNLLPPSMNFARDDVYTPLPPPSDKFIRKRHRFQDENPDDNYFQKRPRFSENSFVRFSPPEAAPGVLQYDPGPAGSGGSFWSSPPRSHRWPSPNQRRGQPEFLEEHRKIVSYRDVVGPAPSSSFRDNDLRVFLDEANRGPTSSLRSRVVGTSEAADESGKMNVHLDRSRVGDISDRNTAADGGKIRESHVSEVAVASQGREGIWVSESGIHQLPSAPWKKGNKKQKKKRQSPRIPVSVVVSTKENRVGASMETNAAAGFHGGQFHKVPEPSSSEGLSVTFKSSGMVAQEAFASGALNQGTDSQSFKAMIQGHSLPVTRKDESKKKEIAGVDNNAFKASGVLEASSLPVKMATVKGSSGEDSSDSSYVEEIDNKIIVSSGQSKEKSVVSSGKQASVADIETLNVVTSKEKIARDKPVTTTKPITQSNDNVETGPSRATSIGAKANIRAIYPKRRSMETGSSVEKLPKKKKLEAGQGSTKNQNMATLSLNSKATNELVSKKQLSQNEIMALNTAQKSLEAVTTHSIEVNSSLIGAVTSQNSGGNVNSKQIHNANTALPGGTIPVCSQVQTKGGHNLSNAHRSKTWHRKTPAAGSSTSNSESTPGVSKNADLTKDKLQSTYVRKGNSLVRASSSSGLSVIPSVGILGPTNVTRVEEQSNKPCKFQLARNNVITQVSTSSSMASIPISSSSFMNATLVDSTPQEFQSPSESQIALFESAGIGLADMKEEFSLVANALKNNEKFSERSDAIHTINIQNEKSFEKVCVSEGGNVSIQKAVSLPSSSLQIEGLNQASKTAMFGIKDVTSDALVEQNKIAYVKPKSNQLIAAQSSKLFSPLSVSEGAQSSSTSTVQDHYYKRNKNQLVRSSLSFDTKGTNAMEMNTVNIPLTRSQHHAEFIRGSLQKVLKHKRFKFQYPKVWTLSAAYSSSLSALQSSRKPSPILPWKRGLFGRSISSGNIKAVPDFSKGSALSLMSKKLSRLRKRDTVYTKSRDGFSLRRSGVLSIGGSSLKWTKSIEKQSKKANEEATMAVAAVERRKREEKEASSMGTAKANTDNNLSTMASGMKAESSKAQESREGDPLHGNALSESQISGSKNFTPKRVTVGCNQYLRVGKGNKLIRDSKSVSRVLANEKVRLSLYTARSRRAKKQQYCQFYTRFGKCDKEDGKCPYIHDRAKVAVCTKFVKGSCSDPNCQLTHKIIPERMEDCSYFLQGLCTNENCAYRHVNVNPNASVCAGFLKGYCADGDKCNKKHTYICPQFAKTGECMERSTCKLRHPKKKVKSKVSSVEKTANQTKRRYFIAGESVSALASLCAQHDALEKSLGTTENPEFISINTSMEDNEANNLVRGVLDSLNAVMSGSCSLESFVSDIDMLIKPVLLFQKDYGVNRSNGKEITERRFGDSSSSI